MARRRYVSTSISTDKLVAKLANEYGDFAALLYTWMLPHAEDDCSVESDHEEIMLSIVPGFRKKKLADIDRAIEGMLSLGLLLKDAAGAYFFPPEAFYKYQSYIKDDKRRTTPENVEILRSTAKVAENAASVSVSPSVPISVSPSSDVVLPVARDAVGEICGEFATYGTSNQYTVSYVEDCIETYSEDWVRRAVRVGGKGKASGDKPPWEYIETILRRWKAEGGPDDDKPPERVQPPQSHGARGSAVHGELVGLGVRLGNV